MVAPDAPHSIGDHDRIDDANDISPIGYHSNDAEWQRTWWHRKDNVYHGLEESITMLLDVWNSGNFIGILGFSQGSRLAHIITVIHRITNGSAFRGLEFVVHVSGYGDCPLPDNLSLYLRNRWGTLSNVESENELIDIPNLHVMGEQDKLVIPLSSLALTTFYKNPVKYTHPGGHHVPVKAGDVQKYLQFFRDLKPRTYSHDNLAECCHPDLEHEQAQIDEVAALSQIFPTEFKLLSEANILDHEDPTDYSQDGRTYRHPIRYSILLRPAEDNDQDQKLWPPKDIHLCIEYSRDYPDSTPNIKLIHDMNYLEFSMQQSDALISVVRMSMEEELGMPCVMGAIYAARDFLDSGRLAASNILAEHVENLGEPRAVNVDEEVVNGNDYGSTILRSSSARRKAECNEQGLEIAELMLHSSQCNAAGDDTSIGKGGFWKYTVGLIGKPSAGKSTFFNAATGFARQRGAGKEHDLAEGGATMAPHPFTTIDPNVGFCLVPAPYGACPEDGGGADVLSKNGLVLGSTHGRDSKGRRLLSVCLKDVAGLVPGAYKGRGKGNKFLDDLTDADVLVHVVDSSGLSDAEGNMIASDEMSNETNHPLTDLAWVRNELVEWVFTNVASKWDSVVRRGRDKLVGMFSGYKQSQRFVMNIFSAVETYVKEKEGRDLFDNLEVWDEGDLHRLVSAFLAVRFPMTLALNKSDLQSSAKFIADIEANLPIYGAYSGTGSAMVLNSPVLVFPVHDMLTYEPLPGMTQYAISDSSLPNVGMVSCLGHVGGIAPSQWDATKHIYTQFLAKSNAKPSLRDVLQMKPGSTVEDVFLGLKWMGALEGEFVRAEGAMNIGDKPRLVSKGDVIGKHNRILRVMTTKRKVWQSS
eukprot:scaffold23177_cov68-Cyclotella_meneghiniana.AAC.1